MKEIKTRIKVVPYSGTYSLSYSFKYYAQVEKSFLGFKYWKNIDWEFGIDLAKSRIDLYLQRERRRSECVKYINYP